MQDTDIKLMESERMDDTDLGGGRMSAVPVVSGEVGQIFPPISEVQHAYGGVMFREVFPYIDTETTETAYDMNFVMAAQPADDRLAVVAFLPSDAWAYRPEAVDYVGRYLVTGGRWSSYLYGTQYAGSQKITMWQRIYSGFDVQLPAVGQTLRLIENEDEAEEYEQFVRITEVSSEQRIFMVDDTQISVMLISCNISSQLEYDFHGPDVSKNEPVVQGVVYDTTVSDAARYAGSVPFAQTASLGDKTVYVDTIYGQLVPASQDEQQLIAQVPVLSLGSPIQAGGTITFSTSVLMGGGRTLYLGMPCTSGSLVITGTGLNTFEEEGNIYNNGDRSTVLGTLDVFSGVLRWEDTAPSFSGAKTVAFTPGGVPAQIASTQGFPVTIETQRREYAYTFAAPLAVGATFVDYRAQGQWYRLAASGGSEVMRGSSPQHGVATFDAGTNTISATLGALPDIGSEVIMGGASQALFLERSGLPVEKITVRIQLANAGIVPSSVTVVWPTGKNATDNGNGAFTGDATGTISYARGEIVLIPTVLPPASAEFEVTYNYGEVIEETFTDPERDINGDVTLDLGNTGVILESSFELEFPTQKVLEVQNGTELLPPVMVYARSVGGVVSSLTGEALGMLNTTTGALTFHAGVSTQIPYVEYEIIAQPPGAPGGPVDYVAVAITYTVAEAGMPASGATVTVRYRETGDTTAQDTETTVLTNLVIDLTSGFQENIVSGSMRFRLGGQVYHDRLGQLVTALDPLTGSVTAAGTLNQSTGQATVTVWTPDQVNDITLDALLTTMGTAHTTAAVWRAAIAPGVPGSLQISATQTDGTQISLLVDPSGQDEGSDMIVSASYDQGVVHVVFGAWVTAAGKEGEPWYREEDIREDGKIFEPLPVWNDSIRYNWVGYVYVPLSAEILGMTPERLPKDGRVPLFRVGSLVLAMHTGSIVLPNPLVAGYSGSIGRTRLARVRVRDQAQKTLPAAAVAALDLDLGTFAFADPLPDLSDYTQPFVLEHTIEDLATCMKVDISGIVEINRQLSHDYPSGSRLGSALFVGDIFAQWTFPFSQSTWTGVWQDTVIGIPPLDQYDYLNYPIEVTNRATVTERWALIFTNTTTFRVIGERLGEIGIGVISEDMAPPNPAAGNDPYWTIRTGGWGGGGSWTTGTVLRFNTTGAHAPVWLCLSIQPGTPSGQTYYFEPVVRCSVDP